MVNSAKKDLKRRTEFYANMCRLQFFKYIVNNHNIPSLLRVRYKALLIGKKTTKVAKWPFNALVGAKAIWSSTDSGLRTTHGLQESTTGIKTKIRNRCIITGRGRGVYRFCKLSRGPLQEKALAGHLNGISKSSW